MGLFIVHKSNAPAPRGTYVYRYDDHYRLVRMKDVGGGKWKIGGEYGPEILHEFLDPYVIPLEGAYNKKAPNLFTYNGAASEGNKTQTTGIGHHLIHDNTPIIIGKPKA